ncbi:TRAP transporter large permease [Desulfocastanea catecholica]
MTPIATGIIAMCIMLFLLALGKPVGFTMLLVGFVGSACLINTGAALHILATTPYEVISSYDFSVIPLFLLMASICLKSELASNLFRLLHVWIGRFPGGLASATIGACAFFSAASSSSIATAVTMGVVAVPEMRKYKYDVGLATGCVAAGGGLGILIPPSGILIVYGIITEQSITKLFIAGLVPGILLTLMFIIMIYIRVRMNPELAKPIEETFTLKEKVKISLESIEMIVLVFGIIAGLILGWFTPTEAGAIGASGAILLSLARKRLSWKGFTEALVNSIQTCGMIFTILIGALVFNTFLAVTTIPMELAGYIGAFDLPPMVILLLIIFLYLILGCFIDSLSMILLTIPIFYPLIVSLNYDPIWFGILIVMVIEVALITPPVGMNVFVINGLFKDIPMQKIFVGIVPFLIVELILIILIITFPDIVLFLPKMFG